MKYQITYGGKKWEWACDNDPEDPQLGRFFEIAAEEELRNKKTGGGMVVYLGEGKADIRTGLNTIGKIERM